jgi:SWIM zinc finger
VGLTFITIGFLSFLRIVTSRPALFRSSASSALALQCCGLAQALAHTYAYAFPSSLGRDGGLALAASGTLEAGRPFFDGSARRPHELALLLRTVSDVVRSRHHVPAAMLEKILLLADPVFTVSADVLRVEGFSSCCGLYARADFDAAAFQGASLEPGSTNVDFNEAIRAALGRVRAQDSARLWVAETGVDLRLSEADQVREVGERKVLLPLRWVKSFLEVQVVQARMEARAELSGGAALRFLRSLPRTSGSTASAWLVPSAGALRLTAQKSSEAVRLAGFSRLRALESVLPTAKRLRVYADAVTRASAWEVELEQARFTLVLSPDTWRGFSGEGQALSALAAGAEGLSRVRALLRWQSELRVDELAAALRVEPGEVARVLARLGSFGAVGFDLARAAWFHRVLPVDLPRLAEHLERQQPRLRAAERLLAEGSINVVSQSELEVVAEVRSDDVIHRVQLLSGEWRCTCPWFAKHQNERGACKHVLAVELASQARSAKGQP